MSNPLIVKWRVGLLLLLLWVPITAFVYFVLHVALWIALLFPLLSYLVYGLLNVVGTLLGRRQERRRPGSPNHR